MTWLLSVFLVVSLYASCLLVLFVVGELTRAFFCKSPRPRMTVRQRSWLAFQRVVF